jgi:hypothetical protein
MRNNPAFQLNIQKTNSQTSDRSLHKNKRRKQQYSNHMADTTTSALFQINLTNQRQYPLLLNNSDALQNPIEQAFCTSLQHRFLSPCLK